jgi:hypothetical protein
MIKINLLEPKWSGMFIEYETHTTWNQKINGIYFDLGNTYLLEPGTPDWVDFFFYYTIYVWKQIKRENPNAN